MIDRPGRWVECPSGGEGAEALAAARLREVQVPELAEARLDAVARRIEAALGQPPRARVVRRARLPFAVALAIGGVGAAALLARVATRESPREPVPAVAPPAAPPSPGPLPPLPSPPSPVEATPAVAPAAPKPAGPPPARPSRGADSLGEESDLLRAALHALNADRDPRAALRLLDRYQARFPSGVLAREAEVARLDADIRLGRNAEALGILDRASAGGLDRYPRPTELELLRAELLSEARRCADAEPLFSAVLTRGVDGAATERALLGRASCRANLGNQAGSQADLRRYLDLFPRGAHAVEARRALAP